MAQLTELMEMPRGCTLYRCAQHSRSLCDIEQSTRAGVLWMLYGATVILAQEVTLAGWIRNRWRRAAREVPRSARGDTTEAKRGSGSPSRTSFATGCSKPLNTQATAPRASDRCWFVRQGRRGVWSIPSDLGWRQHCENVRARKIGPLQLFWGDLPYVSNLVSDRSYMVDGALQPPLSLRIAAEPAAGILPDIGLEEERWQLCQIEIIDNTETICTGRPIPSCTGQHVSLASVECAFDGRRRSIPKTRPINVSDDGSEPQLHLADPLPDNFGSWQEPGRQERRRAGFSAKFPKRYANDLGHARTARDHELIVAHRFPGGWQRVLRAHPA